MTSLGLTPGPKPLILFCHEHQPLISNLGDFGELPPFNKIRPEHYAPAFEAAMEAHRTEIDAIAESREAPSFQNTVVALDRSGQLITRVIGAISTLPPVRPVTPFRRSRAGTDAKGSGSSELAQPPHPGIFVAL
ncbi:hypothetical protein MASR2M48_06620 [Spirochaetota bacterium]